MAILRAVLVIEHDAPSGGSSSAPPFTADGNFSLQIACSWTRAPSRLLLLPPLRTRKAEDLYYAPAELLSD